ncbi:phosphodiester glycosidase family protein [Halomicronema sp. CCY15110]|uniref:phosphodiester glycosidase family protein n=1 Tax=Halomicronema sp. CCY15110 TaxID=2767773 RepID=UPI001EF180F1|nr:phosphodiester glycosidase family protein [Halomicronema sp. CCY15110]
MNCTQGGRSRGWAIASQLTFLAAGLVGLTACAERTTSPPSSSSIAAAVPSASVMDEAAVLPAPVEHHTYALPGSVVQVVMVPPQSGHEVAVAWSGELATLSQQSQTAGAIAAINAGFFDPQNGLTTSYVMVDGAIVADPRQNPRLMENPDLQEVLPAILNRSELRIYDCEDGVQYDIATHAAPVPDRCTLAGAVGAGPQLLPTLTGYEEGFLADNDAGETVRDALGSQWPNARSAVGLKADGTVVLASATQRPETDQPTGLTLAQMADFLASLGVQKALNLDGGSSTGLYFNGQTYWGRLDSAGEPIERPIKSVLVVR